MPRRKKKKPTSKTLEEVRMLAYEGQMYDLIHLMEMAAILHNIGEVRFKMAELEQRDPMPISQHNAYALEQEKLEAELTKLEVEYQTDKEVVIDLMEKQLL
jgi:hypothetical protein